MIAPFNPFGPTHSKPDDLGLQRVIDGRGEISEEQNPFNLLRDDVLVSFAAV